MSNQDELGNAYRWSAAFDRVQQTRRRLIDEAQKVLPPGTRYELSLGPKELSPDRDGLTQGMCWYRNVIMDDEPDWQPGPVWRDGYMVERFVT